MNRQQRLDIAAETVRIVETGHYTAANGRRNDIAADVAACVAATQLFQPADLQSVQARMLAEPATATAIRIEVVNETTLEGVAALLAQGDAPLAALNFASARQPGGGFLSGAQAQEESLARSSALYASLQRAPQYYEQHRRSPSLLYTDAMILSPQCPVFRDDAGHLLPQAQRVSFISAAAPNAGAIADNRPDELPLIAATLQRRAAYVLALAAAQGYRRLVLGAWGCGVFRNDPQQVAGVFAQLLQGPAWRGRFAQVRFSVLDSSTAKPALRAFESAFGGGA